MPGPRRCPLAPRSRRKVGGLQGGLSPCCCLSPPQGLHAAVGLWLLPPNNQQHPPVSLSSLHPPPVPQLPPWCLCGGQTPYPALPPARLSPAQHLRPRRGPHLRLQPTVTGGTPKPPLHLLPMQWQRRAGGRHRNGFIHCQEGSRDPGGGIWGAADVPSPCNLHGMAIPRCPGRR